MLVVSRANNMAINFEYVDTFFVEGRKIVGYLLEDNAPIFSLRFWVKARKPSVFATFDTKDDAEFWFTKICEHYNDGADICYLP